MLRLALGALFQSRKSAATVCRMAALHIRTNGRRRIGSKVTANADALRDFNDAKPFLSLRGHGVWAQILLGLLLFCANSPANADERILRYVSQVDVQKDSSLQVTETINVRAERERINHGIYRDFPTRYRRPQGSMVHVGFKFDGATMDGMPVPASTEAANNGVRIKIGAPDKFVEEGEHSYVLRYHTSRQIG